jgi:polyhydroxyalkanoate synthesis regulator protein
MAPPRELAPILIHRYGGNRFYDTLAMSYISVDVLRGWDRVGISFVILDAETGWNVTRAVALLVLSSRSKKVARRGSRPSSPGQPV